MEEFSLLPLHSSCEQERQMLLVGESEPGKREDDAEEEKKEGLQVIVIKSSSLSHRR